MKLLKTILLVFAILAAFSVWWTREVDLQSLSAYATAINVAFYRTMHLCMFAFFILNAQGFKKYVTEYVIALGIAFIFIFDMYDFPLLHNIATAFTVILACFTLLVNTEPGLKERIAIPLVIGAVFSFCIGYFTSFHHLFAEIITMSLISTGKLIEIHNKR